MLILGHCENMSWGGFAKVVFTSAAFRGCLDMLVACVGHDGAVVYFNILQNRSWGWSVAELDRVIAHRGIGLEA
jgi:hypothetical protein